MAILRMSQTINRPIEDVFRAIINVHEFPKWNPTTKKARQLTPGEIRDGTEFELHITGFGKTVQSLRGLRPNERVTLVPHIKQLTGGHTFVLTSEGDSTRVDHELEMSPRGIFKVMGPLMPIIGKKNLRTTVDALKKWLEA
jgi:uncharacterized protein YndB with AHSA1/START domain